MRTTTAQSLLCSLTTVLCATACSSALEHTVDAKLLREMSRQGQLWVYDAENEIVVSLDQLDEANDALSAVRLRMKRAARAVERAAKRNKGVQAAEAWLVYLESLEDWAAAYVELQAFGVSVARAGLELAKAQVIHREDLLGGKGFALKEFDLQHQRLRRRYDQRLLGVSKLRKSARKREAKWWQIRRRYVSRSKDYDSGLWVD